MPRLHLQVLELRERLENRVRPALSKARAEIDVLLERLEPHAGGEERAVRLLLARPLCGRLAGQRPQTLV